MITAAPVVSSPLVYLNMATVEVIGCFYAVDLGWKTTPQHHRVDHNLVCACKQGTGCPAVIAVRGYLLSGGQSAPEPRRGYYPVRPAHCPICGASTAYESSLTSRFRGAGWVCVEGGSAHYWQDQGNARVAELRRRRG